ncbi:MAG: hypothetical protein GY811_24535, partial [Myxococcales bacterium]|nr:hypothetical protein [Myxococcales bacterium]
MPRLVYTVALIVSLGAACNRPKKNVGSQVDTAPAIAEVDCPPASKGAAVLMQKGSITLFGEMHGTSEIPSFVGELACLASKTGRVIVGLEMPSSMKGGLEAYLASDGSKEAQQELFKHRFWSYEDGRSSHAMLALIDTLRELKQAGRAVQLFGFDGMFLLGAEARDKGMATNIIDTLRESDSTNAVALLLSGNMHAQTSTERWMGWHVRKAFPHLRSLNNAYSLGSAWVCTGDGCGPMELHGQDRGEKRLVELSDKPDEHGYDGIFYVGAVSASAPATGDHVVKADVSKNKPSVRSKATAAYR